MPIYEFEGIRPVVDPTAFVHPTAVLIGDVIVGPQCFVGPCAVMRGDIGRLILERGSNLQDTCVVHSFPGDDTIVEENGHIGHGAVLHGCTIKKNALVGMNAVVMDNAVIGENSFVAAMAFVKAGMQVSSNVVVAGCQQQSSRNCLSKKYSGRGTAHERINILPIDITQQAKSASHYRKLSQIENEFLTQTTLQNKSSKVSRVRIRLQDLAQHQRIMLRCLYLHWFGSFHARA